jgi:hypothetical protein
MDQTLVGRQDILKTTLMAIFDIILRFCAVQQQLYSAALTEVHRKGRIESDSARDTIKGEKLITIPILLSKSYLDNNIGKWGVTNIIDEENRIADLQLQKLSKDISEKMEEILTAYSDNITLLISSLRKVTCGTANFRFLAFRLDFNEFYFR